MSKSAIRFHNHPSGYSEWGKGPGFGNNLPFSVMFLYGIQIFNWGEVIRKRFPLRHRGQETTLGCQGRNIMKEMELVLKVDCVLHQFRGRPGRPLIGYGDRISPRI